MIELIHCIVQIISLLVILCYCALNYWIVLRWRNIQKAEKVETHRPTITFSVLIPARNEEDNIKLIVESIISQDYPSQLIQIIVINDHSTDKTLEYLKNYPEVQIIQLKNNPTTANKKLAIEKGIEIATGEFIVTTDADCNWQKDLLRLTDQLIIKEKSDVICGNIMIKVDPSSQILNTFEQIDTAGMMLVTAAGIQSQKYHLANGAFLVYRKMDFLALNPYDDNKQIASGDDIFLIQKMAESYKKISFLKNSAALIETSSNTNWISFFQQRKRWAGKNKTMAGLGIKIVMGIPYLTSLLTITLIFIAIFKPEILSTVSFLIVLKLLGDVILYKKIKEFYGLPLSWLIMPLFSFMHTVYIFVFGTYSLLKRRPSGKW